MAKEDIYRTALTQERAVESYISKLFPEDQADVRRFINDRSAEGYSAGRISKYLASLVTIRRRLGRPLCEASSEDLKHWTKHDLKVILRRYMRWLGRGEAVDWIRIRQPKNGDLPAEILTEEEIQGIAQAGYTARDRAFVLSLYESGCRVGELLPLKLKHIDFDRYGAVLKVSGKTGDRRIRLVFSSIPLQRWMEEHPAKNDPEAYLWCKVPMPNNPKWKNDHLSYGFISRLLQELAEKAGVKKKVNPHAFRHARATFMARHLKEPEMREFFGWDRDSDTPSVYVHLSGRDVDDSVLSIYGIKETDKERGSELKTFECPRCREKNDSTRLYCGRCGRDAPALGATVRHRRLLRKGKIARTAT